MSVPTFPPPAPEAIELLRQKPSYQQEASQQIIDRFATGEIGSEETVLLLQQAALNQVTQAQLLRGLQHETGDTNIEQQAAEREKQAREMLQNQNNELPTIIDEDEKEAELQTSPVGIPGRVLSSVGAVDVSIPSKPAAATHGLGGASGSWDGPATTPLASAPNSGLVSGIAGAIIIGTAGAIVVEEGAVSASNADGFDDQNPEDYENYPAEEDPTDFED
jgi:hypothetical protein